MELSKIIQEKEVASRNTLKTKCATIIDEGIRADTAINGYIFIKQLFTNLRLQEITEIVKEIKAGKSIADF